ncbi:ParB/RepB/Spo0J family partition protein [Solimonas marina]|uniref:ParB/RepB/Spo0J family partition protein n=1 Tax=Solimonas marina TaxID=2714601 RepID=A0A969WH90_9GAMM|nr:ParB/RepB/Spo0J family partition protein [Solimonas marina]NKF24645.1 ParB/RepB/Spo0J family partition protein [Solimonas marina]
MKTTFQNINLSELKASADNPRFELNDLDELAVSIKTFGILQPLAVRKTTDGYEIIAGHRRAEAAKRAGLRVVPCVIRTDKGSVVMQQLVENTQRSDLLPFEIAAGINLAVRERKIKQKQLAAELGKSEAWVSKYITIGKAIEKRVTEQKKAWSRETDSEQTEEEYESEMLDRALEEYRDANADTVYLKASKYLNPEKHKPQTVTTTTTTTKPEEQLQLPELQQKNRLAALLMQWVKDNDINVTGYDVTPVGEKGWRFALAFESEKALEQTLTTLKPVK